MAKSAAQTFIDGRYCDYIYRDVAILDIVDPKWEHDSLSDDDLTIEIEEHRTQEDLDATNTYPRDTIAGAKKPVNVWNELKLNQFLNPKVKKSFASKFR